MKVGETVMSEMYDMKIKCFKSDNETDEAKAWNSAQLAIQVHQDIGNELDYALTDLAKRFPEFTFSAISSLTGPMHPSNIQVHKNG